MSQTEKFIKPKIISDAMTDNSLDGTVDAHTEHWDRVRQSLERLIAKRMPDGRYERFGRTDGCITFNDFHRYVEGGYSKAQRQRHDQHWVACPDCSEFMDVLTRSARSRPVTYLFNRIRNTPARVIDYFHEKGLWS